MATYAIHNDGATSFASQADPASVTRLPADPLALGAGAPGGLPSRRGSLSATGGGADDVAAAEVGVEHAAPSFAGVDPQAQAQAGSTLPQPHPIAPAASTELADLAKPKPALAADPAGGLAAGAASLPKGGKRRGASGRRVYKDTRDDLKGAPWSRGKKICCALSLLFLAALITMGILIYFLVRTPTVSYQTSQIVCDSDVASLLRCAQDEIQVKVFVNVHNPNIIGATIDGDLALYREDGTFLGPGRIEDSEVGARSDTTLEALFNITSQTGYPILSQLFIPPTRDVPVRVDGTIYIHVGLLRPSVQFTQEVVIPKQDLVATIGGLIGNAPSVGDLVGAAGAAAAPVAPVAQEQAGNAVAEGVAAIPADLPSTVVGQIPVVGGLAGLIPNLPTSGDTSAGEGASASASPSPSPPSEGAGAAAAGAPASAGANANRPQALPRSHLHSLQASHRATQLSVLQAPPIDARRFAQALLLVGAPGSDKRLAFERQQRAQQARLDQAQASKQQATALAAHAPLAAHIKTATMR